MGVDYTQYCVVGICVDSEDIKTVISEAVYEDQKRYNTRTGEVKSTERVMIKDEQVEYSLMEFKSPDLWDGILYEIENKYEDLITYYDYNTNEIFIGVEVGERIAGYGVDMIEGSIDLDDFNDLVETAKALLPNEKVHLHFFTSVG